MIKEITCHGYTTTLGLAEFREKVLNKLNRYEEIIGKPGQRKIVSTSSTLWLSILYFVLNRTSSFAPESQEDLAKSLL